MFLKVAVTNMLCFMQARLTTLLPADDHPKSSVPVYYREKDQQHDIPDVLVCIFEITKKV